MCYFGEVTLLVWFMKAPFQIYNINEAKLSDTWYVT